MRHLPLLALSAALAIVSQSIASADAPDDTALWRPRMATPALVALDSSVNRTFVAEVKAPPTAGHWQASLANDLKRWPCSVVSAAFGKIKYGTDPGWKITCQVPADLSPELFDLTISSDAMRGAQPQAVSASPTFATDFYILHQSDEQIVNEIHTDPAGTYLQMVGSAEELHWNQQPVNLIHPRFVLITGDQIDYNGALDGWNNWPNWGYRPGAKKFFSVKETTEIEDRLSRMYLQYHAGGRVPYVETPGNHDVTPEDKKLKGDGTLWHATSIEYYERYFGQRSWSFRMGDFYVLMHDWTDTVLKDWSTADYAKASADPSVKYRLIGQHFHTDKALVPAACDLMLIGHGHQTKTIQAQPYCIYEDGPTFKYGRSGFFNFRKTDSGWSCDQTQKPRDEMKDVWPLFTANGKMNTVRSDAPDAMNVTTGAVTITNDLPEEFYDGRVRFIVASDQSVAVSNGTILAKYAYGDGTRSAVLVKVDILANSSITVRTELSHR